MITSLRRPALLLLYLIPAVSLADDKDERRYTEIAGSGRSAMAIAVPPAVDGGAGVAVSQTLQQVMTRDLTLVGLFKVLDPKGYLANLAAEGTGIDPGPWDRIGAQYVVKSRAGGSAARPVVDFLLYDVSKASTPVLTRRYEGKPPRRLAHRFGDDILRYFGGSAGLFNSRIAFARRSAGQSQVYVMDYDGHGAHRASHTGPANLLPAWSPTGQLAWTSLLWRNPDLYLAATPGGRALRISQQPGLNSGAAFSPDGKRIALTLSKDGNAEIYLITVGGTLLRRLTHDEGIDTSPSWSPDGAQLAFVSDRGGTAQIYVVSAAGGTPRRVTFQGGYNQEPSWCPVTGSKLIAFTGQDEHGAYDIYTVDVGSGDVVRLTQRESTPGRGNNQSPSWSPGGQLIVFGSSRGGLWLIDAEGNNPQQVYRGNALTPAWSR